VPNRLANETSPYLLQHANNPVDWYPWGPEALERARREDRPILLSIGYAACHWCHVMEHESFEHEGIARLMNERFVNIKVDREERPDIDEIYMKAVQAMTGAGGWPMSVFLTPELEPFFGGTYFPPRGAHGRPGFADVLLEMKKQPDPKLLHATCTGLDGRDERLLQWITDSGLAVLIADNYAVEIIPTSLTRPAPHALMPLHEHCLFKNGIHLGEMWYLTELARWLREHQRSRFLLTAPPLRLPGAVGSPATPVATV
jgi:hypothetical protein